MQKRDGVVLYSASDLVNYLECEHLTSLDLIDLETPLPRTEDSDEAKLIQAKGYSHESAFFEQLKARHPRVIDIAVTGGSNAQKVAATTQAMRDGYDIIFQATLQEGCLIGHADFLRKVSIPSVLGPWSYEVLDTKLSRSPKAKFIIQLAFYSSMVGKVQGVEPQLMHVILGDKSEATYRFADYARYLGLITQRFLERVQGSAVETYPVPCAKCDQCKWSGLCDERRLSDDHLSQVANITRLQVKKLELAGVKTLEALAKLPADTRILKMPPETLTKLHKQARLQLMARETGKRHLELLPEGEEQLRGFSRLPLPAEGDLFFDMEGDPLEEGGLEYLFGLYFFENGKSQFKAFWAHSRSEEKVAFEAFMDFVTAWLRKYPNAFIYHYAAYEQTALKRLMSLHGTREAEVDNLLRAQKLVDLYKVVREGIRVSEPRYSIKNIEHFYLESRTGDVKNAGASIVYYEKWKETADPQLLKDIEDYNYDDVRSTYELRQWLLTLRPAHLDWFTPRATKEETPEVGELTDEERRLIPYREFLVDRLPQVRNSWGQEERLFELTYQLLDFHRRAAKPEWWAMFSRKELSEEELLEDGECLAGLWPDSANPPRKEARSVRYSFFFPEQESKFKTGDSASIAQTSDPVSGVVIDEERRHVSFKLSSSRDPLSLPVALGPGMPVSSKALIEAVFRFADSLVKGERTYSAIEAILTQSLPSIAGHTKGAPILSSSTDALPEIIDAISNLDGSYIFVQGPPGAGKTYTGSHVIVSLLRQGYKVGISSNSHKAINNLLHGVEKVAKAEGSVFRGAKKSTSGKPESCLEGEFIEDIFVNSDILECLDGEGAYHLVAGTAWLFADSDVNQKLDYIFVDEAGQVALANLVAMGTSARNIVLLGDQMQLGQPIQGIHPGRSGESSLEYLLNGKATIPAEQGIFLEKTWRMHPDVCRFISDAVYDGRLEAEPNNANQALLLNGNAHPALKPTGKGYHDSGHTKGRPTWIYDFPHYGGAQVGIPLNKECLTLYLRDKTQSGPLLSEILPEGIIEKRYPADGKPAGSVGRAAYLAPSGGNRLLKVNLPREDVLRVLDAYFGVQTKPESQAASYSGAENPITRDSIPRRRPNGAISAEEFENQLDRKSEIGKAGELIAVLDELERLRSLGCLEPEKYVNRVALTDIGRGYDIESVWPNEKRYIEVKSSTSLESDFYISDNECKTLAGLGDAAWLYRVHVLEGGLGTVTKRVQNPMNAIAEEAMSPVVWRVSASALK